MALKLYDTLTRAKVDFVPLNPEHVRMYVCGPTVYDDAHIGNARPAIVFDVLFRLLRHVYGAERVTYARNITDVDDKINLRAHERGISIRELTEETATRYRNAVLGLNCLPPTFEPRATDHMAGMAAMIDRLIARGVAYVAEEHALFHVPAMAGMPGMPRYGSLARRALDEMLAGARVDVAPYKRDPMDFVLWKPSRAAHEPGWPSPGGLATPGRPGWHIECSAMSMATLLEPWGGGLSCDDPTKNMFDIHGGGIDLTFPHHENEIAQSCCAFGAPAMASVWMHNGFLQVEGEKMSKSLGNFVTIDELLNTEAFGGRRWPGEVLRLAMLRTHYRQPIDWTERSLRESLKTYRTWALRMKEPPTEPSQAFIDALSDDLNTPAAIAELHKLAARAAGYDEPGEAAGQLAASLKLLGFDDLVSLGQMRAELDEPSNERIRQTLNEVAARIFGSNESLAPEIEDIDVAEVQRLIAQRLAARKAKDFAASDRLRDELTALGVILKDGKDPATGEPVTTWEVKR